MIPFPEFVRALFIASALLCLLVTLSLDHQRKHPLDESTQIDKDTFC